MKTCPICQAITFDDATTCFGCLHRYNSGDADESPLFGEAVSSQAFRADGKDAGCSGDVNGLACGAEGGIGPGNGVGFVGNAADEEIAQAAELVEDVVVEPIELHAVVDAVLDEDVAPAFYIKLVPTREESGSIIWSCSVELG